MLTIWMNGIAHAGGIEIPTEVRPPMAKVDALPLDPAPAKRHRRHIVGWLIRHLADRNRRPLASGLTGSTAGA